VKGIGLAGAVLALDQAGYRFRRIAGTSAGAIAAALIAALNAAGRPLADLNTILRTCDYPRFMAKSRLREALGQVGDVERLLLHMGMYDGDYLIEWLGGALEDIGITTFGQLGTAGDLDADSNWQPSQRYSLVVHTADITRGKLVRLPWDYPAYGLKPDEVRIVEAVRASMSIPFFFEPVRVDAPEAVMGGVSYAAGKVTWVDGGMLSNFPIEVFDRTDGAPSRWPTIGIKLSARATSIAAKDDVGNVVEEAIACLRTLLDNADRYYVTQDKAARTIFIDNGGIKATDFHLQVSQQDMLFGNGTTAAQTWLAARRARATTPVALPADSRDT
jgi:NTE family protein